MAVNRGFTLLEMLIVLAILGIASMVVISSLPRAATGAEAGAADYVGVLRRSRLAAVQRGIRVQSSIRTDGHYEVRVGTSATGPVLESGRSTACDNRLTVVSPTVHTMDPSGLAFGDTAKFACADTVVSVVVMSMEGRFSIAR